MDRKGWMRRTVCLGMICFLIAGSGGCASYNARTVNLQGNGPNMAKSGNEVCLSVDEYATEAKCRQAFDSDLAGQGVLALLVKIENNGKEPFEVTAENFTVNGDSNLHRISADDAAAKAKRNAVSRAIGWSLIVPIIAIPVAATASAIHTKDVNKKIRQDFIAKAFKDGSLMPNKERTGFLFYELPAGRKDLRGLELAMTLPNTGIQEPTRVVTPLPDASFKAPKQIKTSNEEERTANGGTEK